MNTVASRLSANVNHRIFDAPCARKEKLLATRDSQRQRVHQRIVRIAWLELHLSADVRHTEAVAVKADPAHHAIENAPVPLNLFLTHNHAVTPGRVRRAFVLPAIFAGGRRSEGSALAGPW